MELIFTSPEKVLFKATKNFHLQNGDSESEAIDKATNKIIQKRSVAKTLTFKH
jgi:hypothetical protein